MKKIENVLFDLDGTLLNSVEDIRYAINIALKQFKLPEISTDIVAASVGAGADIFVDRVFKKLESEDNNKKYLDSIKKEFREYYFGIYLENSIVYGNLYEGVYEGLEKLYNKGLNLFVVSNKPHSIAIDCINKLSIDKFFKKVIGDGYYNVKKPAKELWQKIEKEFSMSNENTVIVGDGTQDIDFAHNANIEVLVVLYGGITNEDLLINMKEKNYFKSFNSITEYILNYSK